MTKALRSEKGFTLIELVIIIILLGLLAAVAIPRSIDLREDARKAAAQGNLDAARAALTLDFASAVAKPQRPSLTITTATRSPASSRPGWRARPSLPLASPGCPSPMGPAPARRWM